ncbi:MAG: hypothetical protein FD135_2654 [Comamonadaceae bacterium]|nr:MAG: hypothetical protein FD135_2654 [Comamonadaceae bacterium]
MALVGPPRAMCPQAIHQAGLGSWQITVPDLSGVAGQGHAGQFGAAIGIKQTQLDAMGMAGKHGNIHAMPIKMSPQGPRMSGLQTLCNQLFHAKNTVDKGGRVIMME